MLKIVFLHPDLGIGGAEKAVIDAALALKAKSHTVEFVTAHHDKNHCFEETKNGTLKVTVAGDWLPRSFFGKFYAFCAYVRMIYAALYLVLFSGIDYDCIFCDQISACIPFIRLGKKTKILFYCHFPDMLLTQRNTYLKSLYRKPIDWFEEKTTGMADLVLVNSKFTASIFENTFTSLKHITPEVLYPVPNYDALNQPIDVDSTEDLITLPKADTLFLSINRYERKKNLSLAIKSLSVLQEKLGGSLKSIHLIMAGGYDDRVKENVQHYMELRNLTHQLDLDDKVTFLRSFSNSQKISLFNQSSCLLYTPDKEHFGIVPVEAMYLKCPVIAVNSGGPLETVDSNVTGFLCNSTPHDFSEAMKEFVDNKGLSTKQGNAGRKRVEEKFSFDTFTEQLNTIIDTLIKHT